MRAHSTVMFILFCLIISPAVVFAQGKRTSLPRSLLFLTGLRAGPSRLKKSPVRSTISGAMSTTTAWMTFLCWIRREISSSETSGTAASKT
jgi:hypothetical protein